MKNKKIITWSIAIIMIAYIFISIFIIHKEEMILLIRIILFIIISIPVLGLSWLANFEINRVKKEREAIPIIETLKGCLSALSIETPVLISAIENLEKFKDLDHLDETLIDWAGKELSIMIAEETISISECIEPLKKYEKAANIINYWKEKNKEYYR